MAILLKQNNPDEIKMEKIEKYFSKYEKKDEQGKIAYEKYLARLGGRGNLDAQLALGYILSCNPLPDSERHRQGLELLKTAAADDNPMALRILAQVYGIEVDVTPEKLRKIFQIYYRGRNSNNSHLLAELGKCYLLGQGCRRSIRMAKKYLKQAAELGSNYAAYYMGFLVLYGDDAKRLDLLLEKELEGYAVFDFCSSENDLLYDASQDNYPEAVLWFEKACPKGAWLLGTMLQKLGFQKDAARAFRAGEKCGNMMCAGDLALCYLFGTGVKKNIRKAYDLLFDNIDHPWNMGICYGLAAGEWGDIPPDPLGRFDKEGNVITCEQKAEIKR